MIIMLWHSGAAVDVIIRIASTATAIDVDDGTTCAAKNAFLIIVMSLHCYLFIYCTS